MTDGQSVYSVSQIQTYYQTYDNRRLVGKDSYADISLGSRNQIYFICYGYPNTINNVGILSIQYNWTGNSFTYTELNKGSDWVLPPSFEIINNALRVTQKHEDGTIVQICKLA